MSGVGKCGSIGSPLLVVRRGFGYYGLQGCSGVVDSGEDLVSRPLPYEWGGVLVPGFDPGVDRFSQFVDGVERAVREPFAGQDREPAFDQVQP